MSETSPPHDRSAWLPGGDAQPVAARPAPAAPQWPPPSPPRPARAGGVRGIAGRDVVLPAWLLGLGVLALVAALGACAVLAARDTTDSPAPAAATQASRPARPVVTEVEKPLRDPFTVDRVRWAVFLNPSQRWSAFAKTEPAGAGRRWVLVSVRLHNLTRPAFVPASQPTRLVDTSGQTYAPDATHSNAPASSPAIVPDARGQLELAYRIPKGVTALRFSFTAGPRTRVTVPVTAP